MKELQLDLSSRLLALSVTWLTRQVATHEGEGIICSINSSRQCFVSSFFLLPVFFDAPQEK